jgi:hypothetical protein
MGAWGSVRACRLKAPALVLCLLALLSTAGLCAGQREAQISDVMRLMEARDYPSALRLLATIQRQHPEQQDTTERMMVQIIAIQGREYNAALSQLVQALYVEQDERKASQIIDTLRKLDPNRSIADAQKSVAYIKFLKLMRQAAALLGKGRAGEAIDLYLQPILDPARAGLDLEKPQFEAAGYGGMVVATARDLVRQMVGEASAARNKVDGLRGARGPLPSLLSGAQGPESLARLSDVFAPLEVAASQERAVAATASALSDLRRSTGKSDTYLQYLVWLCRGRENKPAEGLAAAIRLLWQDQAASMAAAAYSSSVAAYTSALRTYDRRDFASADAALVDAYYRAVIAVKIASFQGAAVHLQSDWGVPKNDSALVVSILEKTRQAQVLAAQASSLRKLISLKRQAQALPVVGQDPQALAAARAQTQALVDGALAGQKEWSATAEELTAQERLGMSLKPQAEAARDMAGRFVSMASLQEDRDLACAVAKARIDSAPFADRLARAVMIRLEGQDRTNGTVNGKPPAQNVIVESRPREALKLYNQASSLLAGIDADAGSLRSEWVADRTYVTASPDMKALLSSLDAMEAKSASERNELDRQTQLAQQQHEQAVAKGKNGDLAFEDCLRALAAKQYDNAKIQLGDARDLYFDSLLMEEDGRIRKRYAVDIPSLIDRINTAIVQQYVAGVDSQISDGRRLFSAGEYLKAFLVLETAQARWKDIWKHQSYDERSRKLVERDRPNAELDELLESVRNALSGGRDLAPEDSRAPTVNGFLKLANDKMAQAEKLPKDDPGRAQLLGDAWANVSSALDVDPVYRTAKALQLRIRKLQARDDDSFRVEAKSEIDSIIAEYHSGKGERNRLYFALKDYQDILPDYQPLKDVVQELEISLGFRLRPPSALDIARSNEALARARGVYDPGNSWSYDSALKDLDTAIKLNPANAAALALRRTILLKEGSPEASAISSTDLARFAESKRRFNTGDISGAYQILVTLVASDRNANYPPIAQLYHLTRQRMGF